MYFNRWELAGVNGKCYGNGGSVQKGGEWETDCIVESAYGFFSEIKLELTGNTLLSVINYSHETEDECLLEDGNSELEARQRKKKCIPR